jgi:hypothetical protein
MRADSALALRRGWCWFALAAVLIVADGCVRPGQAASDPGVSTGPASGEASSPAAQPPGSTAGPSTEPAPSTDTPFVTEVPLSWTPPTTPGASDVSPPAFTSSASPDTSSHPYTPPPSDVLPAGCPGGTVTVRHSTDQPSSSVCVRVGAVLQITLTRGFADGWAPVTIKPGNAATVLRTEVRPETIGRYVTPNGIRTATVQIRQASALTISSVNGGWGPGEEDPEAPPVVEWAQHVTVRP